MVVRCSIGSSCTLYILSLFTKSLMIFLPIDFSQTCESVLFIILWSHFSQNDFLVLYGFQLFLTKGTENSFQPVVRCIGSTLALAINLSHRRRDLLNLPTLYLFTFLWGLRNLLRIHFTDFY